MSHEVNWTECMPYAAVSDVGMRRSNNQDAHSVVLTSDFESWKRRGHVFVVADGMGAHAAGELASELAAAGVPHHYHKYHDLSPPEALDKAIRETNAEVHRRGQANTDFHNMGTTTSVLLLLPQGGLVAHVGDSRVYRLRGDKLDQLTFDHSLVWELRAAGQISEDSDLAGAVPRNVITRSLGPNATVQVDFEGPFPLEVGDTYLLCSDGLTGTVRDEELGAVLGSLPPDEAAQVLVDLANLRGGPDNITAVVVRVACEQMTTRIVDAQPLQIGSHRASQARRVHPGLWVVAGICFLSAIAFLAIDQQWVPAGVAGLGGLVAVAAGLWQWWRGHRRGVLLGQGRKLGRGPYRTTACPCDAQFVGQLSDIVDELRDAADENNWTLDVQTVALHCQAAEQSLQQRQYAQSVRHYGLAIRFIMEQLRSQHRRRNGTSIDY